MTNEELLEEIEDREWTEWLTAMYEKSVADNYARTV